ncbi:nuclease-related domain-containing protein [Halalkalibacter okhensis]|uniref:nuclease-related domain-containing protein n=1 Tax=Halalkalibacter okhensis TaxID=333138 RepID=UPI000691D418|nr:nuclease-related domain-containing protein [Halalkalibacter okhensis]
MIVKKERKIPLKILKLEALLRRLPAHHSIRNKIEEELKKRKAGYRGEQAIDYHLKTQPIDDGLILHDNRLKQGKDHFFQIDTLIVTTRFFMILEIKNITGTLYFDQEFQQLIRKKMEKKRSFKTQSYR